jgi:hypothetical protein
MTPSAEQIVRGWLEDLGMNLRPYEDCSEYQKWWDKGWRFYLYKNLDFSGYSIWRCSYIKVSLTNPESINKIESWIKENKT